MTEGAQAPDVTGRAADVLVVHLVTPDAGTDAEDETAPAEPRALGGDSVTVAGPLSGRVPPTQLAVLDHPPVVLFHTYCPQAGTAGPSAAAAATAASSGRLARPRRARQVCVVADSI